MTPLLRWGDALLKLEMFQPRGSVSDRAVAPQGPLEVSGNQALSFARSGAEFALRGAVTHEMREALRIWGARIVSSAPAWRPDPSAFESLGAELLEQLSAPPALIVCPAGEGAALLGALTALRRRWPQVRGAAVVAADTELPDLPRATDLPQEIERVPVTRAAAAVARGRLGRELGVLANHAGAAAAACALGRGGVAIVTALGEREFSLEGAP